MENNLILLFLIIDLIGFFAAWVLTRNHKDKIELRGIAYCFTLFAVGDFSYIMFGGMISDSLMMMLELGMSADWFVIRLVTASLCGHALLRELYDDHKDGVHQ